MTRPETVAILASCWRKLLGSPCTIVHVQKFNILCAPLSNWTVSISNLGSAEGTLILNMVNNSGLNLDVNNLPFAGETYTIDHVGPTAAVMVADPVLTVSETSLVTFTFNEAVTGFTNADLAVANGTLSSVSTANGGITWTATFTPTATFVDATNVITLDKSAVQDLAGNAGTGTMDSNNYKIDTRPVTTVSSIIRTTPSGQLTSASSVTYTVRFATATLGLTASNFDLTGTALVADANIVDPPVTGDNGLTWTVSVTGLGGAQGTMTLNLVNHTGLDHLPNNNLPLAGETYTLDPRPITTVSSIIRATPSGQLTNTSSVSYTVRFATATLGLTASNFDLTGTALVADTNIVDPPMTGDNGLTWTVSVDNLGNTNGTLVLNLVNNLGLVDHYSTNLPLAGETYTLDHAGPTTVTIVVANTGLDIGETSLVTFTFNEAVTGFTNDDLTMANGTLSPVSSADGGKTWTATFTPTAGIVDATNVIALDKSAVQDLAGNAGTGTTNSNNYAIYTQAGSTAVSVSIKNDVTDGNMTDIAALIANPGADGKISLREAVTAANKTFGPTTITFDPTVFTPGTSNVPIQLTTGGLTLSTLFVASIVGPEAGVTVRGISTARVFTISPNVTASFSGLTISGGNGGVINSGTTTFTNCTISGNTTTGSSNGGGLANPSGTVTMTNCTISGNTISGAFNGGGMSNGGTATLTNCTISDNIAAVNTVGGLRNNGTLILTNCTISGNTGNGVSNSASKTLTLTNTIVAGTTLGGVDVAGVVTSLGNNLIGNIGTSTGWFGSDLTGTTAAPRNASLVSLGSNGGPTRTMALLPDSPAINMGTATGARSTDQRGYSRVGNVDIGAFEFGAVASTGTAITVTTDPLSQTVSTGSNVSFTAAADANPGVTVQWQVNTGTSFADITGATSTTYSFIAVAGDNGHQFRAVFTNTSDPLVTANTAVATLTVTSGQSQTIGFSALVDAIYGDVNFALSATASSTLPVTFTSSDDDIANVYQLDNVWYVHINAAGSVTITAHQAGNSNFDPAADIAQDLTIAKAASVTTTFGDGPFTYVGTTHIGGSGTVTGAGDLTTEATLMYSAYADGTGTADQTNAGTYYVTAHYDGDANHSASDGDTVAIIIGKATAVITVTPYSTTYDGDPHTATGTATGIGGVDLSAGLDLSGTTHANAGSYTDAWSFTGDTNYNDDSGTVTSTIGNPVPVATILTGPTAFSGSTSATFTFSGTSPTPGPVTFETSLDGGAFAAATTPQNFTGLTEGSHTFQVRAIDSVGNVGDAVSSNWTIDITAPTIEISAPSAAYTMGSSVTYTITYTDANFYASTLAVGDITLISTGTATGIVSVDVGAGNTRTVTISGFTGAGTLGIAIATGTANDKVGNVAPAASLSETFVADPNGILGGGGGGGSGGSGPVDSTKPTVTISGPSAPITAGGSITYTITYADANFNGSTLLASNVTLNRTGTAFGTVSVSPGSGSTRTVTISNITGDGTLGISPAANTASDMAGNQAPAAGPSVTFNVDNTAPMVTISGPSSGSTGRGPITYTITFTDPNFNSVTLTAANITLNKTGSANGTVSVSGAGNTRTVTISSITGNGTLWSSPRIVDSV